MAPAPLAELPLTVERYLAPVDQGVLRPDDHVELLEGVIVAMPPSAPRHAAIASAIDQRLAALVGERAALRPQFPLVAGTKSVPEPDLARVLEGRRTT
jgi:Uma2 family endonuclease